MTRSARCRPSRHEPHPDIARKDTRFVDRSNLYLVCAVDDATDDATVIIRTADTDYDLKMARRKPEAARRIKARRAA